ncbi:MAG: CotH kinase family protein [Hymenobacteraceae bacterium]|nr:CotH kinase family protein [Hymenobacteraceae bacterium]
MARRLLRVLGWLAVGSGVLLAIVPVRWAYWARLEKVPVFWQRIGPVRDALYRLEDPIRRLGDGYSVPDTLPVLRFALVDSAAARWRGQLDSIRARGINVAAGRRWVPATLGAGTEVNTAAPSLDAELTWHGKFRRHWDGRQRSLKVRLGGGATWWGLRGFSLITPDNRDGPGLLLAAQLARTAGVWHPRARVVRVEVNGTDWGLYYAEEAIDAEFMARRGLPGGVLLAPRATWADDFPDHRRDPAYGQGVSFNRASHVHALALEPAFQEVEAPSDSLAAVALGQWARLRDLVTAAPDSPAAVPDSATVAAVFEVAAWGAADALRHLLADRHNLAGDNLHVAFDPRTGRFRPIYRFEGGLVTAERSRGLTNAPTLSYNGGPLPLWLFVNQQPAFRLAKLRALYRLTATPAAVEAALRVAAPATALLTQAPGAQYPIRQRRWVADNLRRDLRHNRALIHRSLTEDAWLYATARVTGGRLRLELLPEGEGPIAVIGVQVRQGKAWRDLPLALHKPLLAGIGLVGAGGELGLVPVRDTLSVPWSAARLAAVRLRVRNALSGQELPASRIRVVTIP